MNLLNSLKTLTLALILSIGIGYAYAAWAPPTQVPTGGNAEAPVNVGSATQLKAGGLGINGLLTAFSGVKMGNNPAPCTSSIAGTIKYDGTDLFGCVNNGGFSWKSLTAVGGGVGAPPGSQSFTSIGTHTFTVPSGVTSITVEVIGGGGGGGGGGVAAYRRSSSGGGGGGGGGYGKETATVSPGQAYTVVVGNGGGGGAGNPNLCCSSASDGRPGETSRFGNLVVASGGNGGGQGGTNDDGARTCHQGIGGAGGTSAATTNASGQRGSNSGPTNGGCSTPGSGGSGHIGYGGGGGGGNGSSLTGQVYGPGQGGSAGAVIINW